MADGKIEIHTLENKVLKSEICEKILRSLPEWFGIESSIIEYSEDVANMYFITAVDGDRHIGFLALKEHGPHSGEAFVLGILKEYHGGGIGRRLFETAEKHLSSLGKKYLTVKTLSSVHPDENYAKTRKFYEALGFLPLEEFPELWGKENPCLLMIKNLNDV